MRSDNPVAAAVERYNSDPLNLVQIVREAQAALGWLSRETQGEIAERLKIPVTRVDGVVTFYSFFYDKPRGAYRLLLSDNITDRMQGNQALHRASARPVSASSAARCPPTASSASI